MCKLFEISNVHAKTFKPIWLKHWSIKSSNTYFCSNIARHLASSCLLTLFENMSSFLFPKSQTGRDRLCFVHTWSPKLRSALKKKKKINEYSYFIYPCSSQSSPPRSAAPSMLSCCNVMKTMAVCPWPRGIIVMNWVIQGPQEDTGTRIKQLGISKLCSWKWRLSAQITVLALK